MLHSLSCFYHCFALCLWCTEAWSCTFCLHVRMQMIKYCFSLGIKLASNISYGDISMCSWEQLLTGAEGKPWHGPSVSQEASQYLSGTWYVSTVVGNVLTVWYSTPKLAFLTGLSYPGFCHMLVGMNNFFRYYIGIVIQYFINIYAIIFCYYDKQCRVLAFDNNCCNQHWITGSDWVSLIADVFG